MPSACAALTEPWVERDETPLMSLGVMQPSAGWFAPANATRSLKAVELACEQGGRWPRVLSNILFGQSSYVGMAYGTPALLQELGSGCCAYVVAAPLTTTLAEYNWPGSAMSWAFVASAGQEEANDALRSYVVSSLKTASPDVLIDVATLLTAPDRPSPRFSASAPAASPLQAVRELKDFLHLSWRQMETATGIAEGTFHYWRRAHAEPRPSSVRKLMSVYGLVYALVRSHGESEALAWLAGGAPERMGLLLGGETEALRAQLETLLGGGPARQPIYHAYRPETDYDEPSPSPRTAPRQATRRAIEHRQSGDR